MAWPESILLPGGKALMNAGKIVVNAEDCCCEPEPQPCEACGEYPTPHRFELVFDADPMSGLPVKLCGGAEWCGNAQSIIVQQVAGQPCWWLGSITCGGATWQVRMIFSETGADVRVWGDVGPIFQTGIPGEPPPSTVCRDGFVTNSHWQTDWLCQDPNIAGYGGRVTVTPL